MQQMIWFLNLDLIVTDVRMLVSSQAFIKTPVTAKMVSNVVRVIVARIYSSGIVYLLELLTLLSFDILDLRRQHNFLCISVIA